ncbi:MAG TPA: KTSC domain-containing protein [Armatimonadota bacterium]|jgi:hypothetical protein
MERVPVESSMLASAGYDRDSQTLEVEFLRGAVYQYYEVPEEVFKKLVEADSVGSYFNACIRNNYDYAETTLRRHAHARW